MFRLDLLLKLLKNKAIHQGADFLVGLANSQGFPYVWSCLSFFQLNEMREEAKTWLVFGPNVASSYFFKRKSVLHLNHEPSFGYRW